MTKKQYPEEEVVREEARPDGLKEHPAGIPRALYLFAALALAGVVTYLTPAFEEFRPWTPGSHVPFTTLFEFRPPTRPRLAGVQERRTRRPRSTEDLLAAAPLPEAVPADPAPVEQADAGVSEALRIPAEEWAGMTKVIEDPDGSMAHFYARLLAVARGEPVIARTLLYSDSINGSDRTARALRQAFAARFGSAGKGWVPIAPGWQYQRHKNVEHEHAGWRTYVVNRGQLEGGRYGLGGVLATNRTPRARARIATVEDGVVGAEVSRFLLFYQAFPGGGDVALAIDGGTPTTLSTAADEVRDLVHEITVPRGPHALDVRVGQGDLRLYGVALESDGPGVVVDGLMLVGAFTRVLLNFDAEHWATQIGQRDPDLIAFWLGGNDAVSKGVGFDAEDYVDHYTEILRNARAGKPTASCLVLSVLDSAERVDGRVRSRRRVPRVVEAQREAARAAGCAFFDGYEAIGGFGTMRRWAHASPRLVSVDYRHLTGEGATVFASLLYKAILKGYDDWLVGGGGTP